jgi:hypothetical protein
MTYFTHNKNVVNDVCSIMSPNLGDYSSEGTCIISCTVDA